MDVLVAVMGGVLGSRFDNGILRPPLHIVIDRLHIHTQDPSRLRLIALCEFEDEIDIALV